LRSHVVARDGDSAVTGNRERTKRRLLVADEVPFIGFRDVLIDLVLRFLDEVIHRGRKIRAVREVRDRLTERRVILNDGHASAPRIDSRPEMLVFGALELARDALLVLRLEDP